MRLVLEVFLVGRCFCHRCYSTFGVLLLERQPQNNSVQSLSLRDGTHGDCYYCVHQAVYNFQRSKISSSMESGLYFRRLVENRNSVVVS